jgi:hypothetical protein
MKIQTISTVIAATILLVGCDKQNTSSGTSSSPAEEQGRATSAAPVAQAAMSAWQQGDESTAVSSFLAADWSARPLFASDSVLSLTEDQFKSLSDTDRQAKSGEMKMIKQLGSFMRLGVAVAQAGRDAASKGDIAQAQKSFTSLKQCGAALSSPDRMSHVQLIGRTFSKMADTELSKIGK